MEYHFDQRSVNVLMRNFFKKLVCVLFIFEFGQLKLFKPV